MRTIKTLLLATAAFGLAGTAAYAERGSDGQLNILFWQAPSTLNTYLSGGDKDVQAASLVIEPLARYDQDGNLVPYLAAEIPTVENGGVSADLTSITWKLADVNWSDGTPVTADDVIFTWKYCTDPAGGCAQGANFADIKTVEAVDPKTVKITFGVPKPHPYAAFTGVTGPIIQKKQFEACMGAKAPECTAQNFGPIGTGPFIVKDFKPNDVVTYEANPNYRDPAKPAFATVNFKGGGDAASAARAVLETGEYDYAWNLQVEPEVLEQMKAAGKGEVISAYGTQVERIDINPFAVAASVGDKRSTKEAGPHPFLSDPAVRRALSIAIDRQTIVDAGYGAGGVPTCNIVPAPPVYASKNVDWCMKQDIEGAKKLLDDAGWKPGGDGIREKDGVRLSVLYQTSTNSVRQATQALVKQWWNEIGVEAELRNVDASVFFGGDPASPDTFQKFFADVQMYTNNFDGTDPERYMGGWSCKVIPSPANQWQGENIVRYCNEEYEKLLAELAKTSKLEDRGNLVIKLNDMLSNDIAQIPLVHRGKVSGKSKTLNGVIINAWDSELWNAADWSRAK